MDAPAGQDGRLEPDGIMSGDPDPHLPIEGVDEVGEVTAEVFVDVTPDDDRGTLDALMVEDAIQPVIDQAGRPPFEGGDGLPVPVEVDEGVLAEGGAGSGSADRPGPGDS